MRCRVVGNDGDADAGHIGRRAIERGIALDTVLREEHENWPDLNGVDLVLLLGSEWSVYWTKVAPSVRAEAVMIAEAHRSGIPIFGICFGAQTIAHALGGRVSRAEAPEIGWYRIDSSMPHVIDPGPWFEWHYDGVTLPPGAVELARTKDAIQAFELGRTFAVQFHPEVTEEIVAGWAVGAGAAELERIGISAEALLVECRVEEPEAARKAVVMFDWFLDSVAGRAAEPS